MKSPLRSPSLSSRKLSLLRWFDASATSVVDPGDDRVQWFRCVPFVLIHLGCLAVFLVGFSWVALAVAVAMYFARMFFITGFYHRYFSHRTFKTSRAFQFVMAFAGSTAVQRGPMWWAAHHRHHHNHSDDHPDHHSPTRKGFWMSHMGWFMTGVAFTTPAKYVRDWMKFPELRFFDRFDWFVPAIYGTGLFFLGVALHRWVPQLGTTGWQMFVWGFFVSTVAVYHATYTINSLAHSWGSRRFVTGDDSRNNFWLALLTLGEGWHNNHHHYPASTRQGFYWWEVDVTYYVLKALSWSGLIWDLRPVPEHALERHRIEKT